MNASEAASPSSLVGVGDSLLLGTASLRSQTLRERNENRPCQ